jgi:hypothetical protein
MSKNAEYAKTVMKRLDKLPSIMLAAVGKTAYLSVLFNTRQDSGEAAYNWHMNINNVQVRAFKPMRGRPPVGSTGEKRSSIGDPTIVVDDRYKDFLERVRGKNLRFLYMYNPIEDPVHARNALIGQALALSTGQDWLEDVAKRSIRAIL